MVSEKKVGEMVSSQCKSIKLFFTFTMSVCILQYIQKCTLEIIFFNFLQLFIVYLFYLYFLFIIYIQQVALCFVVHEYNDDKVELKSN